LDTSIRIIAKEYNQLIRYGHCNDCVKYIYELEELTQELSSAKEITKLFQKDLNTHKDPTAAGTSNDGRNLHVSSDLNNNWEIVTANPENV
jgi:hypothetical protein